MELPESYQRLEEQLEGELRSWVHGGSSPIVNATVDCDGADVEATENRPLWREGGEVPMVRKSLSRLMGPFILLSLFVPLGGSIGPRGRSVVCLRRRPAHATLG